MHAENVFHVPEPSLAELRTLEQFLLSANCQSCGKAVVHGESFVIAGNPSVTWKFHLWCWKKLPEKWRRSVDVYGGTEYAFRAENKL